MGPYVNSGGVDLPEPLSAALPRMLPSQETRGGPPLAMRTTHTSTGIRNWRRHWLQLAAIAVAILSAGATLSVTTAQDSDDVVAGSIVDYILIVTNNGPSDSTDANLTYPLPQEVDFISVEPGFPTCDEPEGIVACSLGFLANGESVTVTISVKVGSAALGD